MATTTDLPAAPLAPHAFDRTGTAPIERPLAAVLGTCLLVHDFLSRRECAALIAAAERRGLRAAESDYPPSYRNNDRQVVDDPVLARRLFARLQGRVPQSIVEKQSGAPATTWRLEGLNERIRLCRYRAGQQFGIHQDGVHHRGRDCRSKLTLMIYLTDAADFEGGDTLFYAAGPAVPAEGDDLVTPVVARVRPRAGSLIVFDHRIWHAGAVVTRGVKHILRSDLIYRRAAAPLPAARPFAPGHEGYVWTLAQLADGRVASGGRDRRIRVWSAAGSLLQVLEAHQQSVLGLAEVRPGVLASVSRDRTLRFWDLDAARALRTVNAHDGAALAITRLSDRRVATAGADRVIAVWTAAGDSLAKLSGHLGWVWALAGVDAESFASASEDGSVKLWSATDLACLVTVRGRYPLRTVDAWRRAPGASLMAAGDIAGVVRVWSVEGSRVELVREFKAHTAAVRRVRFLADGKLATGGEDNRLHLWPADADIPLYASRHENFVTDVTECTDGALLSCGYDGSMQRHSVQPSAAGKAQGAARLRTERLEPLLLDR
ncbi:MAG TPA: 2OG-Fe(II) oxygenase [Burkholderiaceae bacterium]|nr:2OG-Fe(II) oxygenase [Burkholderiaceae bacterium]